jgi:hypothetical protein
MEILVKKIARLGFGETHLLPFSELVLAWLIGWMNNPTAFPGLIVLTALIDKARTSSDPFHFGGRL